MADFFASSVFFQTSMLISVWPHFLHLCRRSTREPLYFGVESSTRVALPQEGQVIGPYRQTRRRLCTTHIQWHPARTMPNDRERWAPKDQLYLGVACFRFW